MKRKRPSITGLLLAIVLTMLFPGAGTILAQDLSVGDPAAMEAAGEPAAETAQVPEPAAPDIAFAADTAGDKSPADDTGSMADPLQLPVESDQIAPGSETSALPDDISAASDQGTADTADTAAPPETGVPVGETAVCATDCAGVAPQPATSEVRTGFVRDLPLSGLTVIAGWQMSGASEEANIDDSPAGGAQFLPTGRYGADRLIRHCALVSERGAAGGIASATATLYYPEDAAIVSDATEAAGGCGQVRSEAPLVAVDDAEAGRLLCDGIRTENNNLVGWQADAASGIYYGYDLVCGQEGWLARQAVSLYCADLELSYDDPAGEYRLNTSIRTEDGREAVSDSRFAYLELTTFESDFTAIQYGPVGTGEWKDVAGDQAWLDGTAPSIRNTGNTRLAVKVRQNDFGLGRENGDWNIIYRARLGGGEMVEYSPDETATLNGEIGLGATVAVDFGALIRRFPPADSRPAFWGNMVISADKAPALNCH